MTQAAKPTDLERRRVASAKLCLVLFTLVLLLLAAWQCAEASPVVRALERGSLSGGSVEGGGVDPLSISQEGIAFMQANDKGTIFWYESSWNIVQTKALFSKALGSGGWQCLSGDEEQALIFCYAANASSGGGSLYVCFYALEEGCSVLVELL